MKLVAKSSFTLQLDNKKAPTSRAVVFLNIDHPIVGAVRATGVDSAAAKSSGKL